jgi:hypothetical protein
MALLFKVSIIPKIHDDTKTATRRPTKPLVKEVGRYRFKTELFKAQPDSIQVDHLYQQPLRAMTQTDAKRKDILPSKDSRRSGHLSSKPTIPNKSSGSWNSGTLGSPRPYN